jgi:hypothetical protein
MDVNDTIKVKEIDNDKLTFLDPTNSVVIAIKSARAMAAMGADMELDEDEEEGTEAAAEDSEGEESGAEGEGQESSEGEE